MQYFVSLLVQTLLNTNSPRIPVLSCGKAELCAKELGTKSLYFLGKYRHWDINQLKVVINKCRCRLSLERIRCKNNFLKQDSYYHETMEKKMTTPTECAKACNQSATLQHSKRLGQRMQQTQKNEPGLQRTGTTT